MRPSRRQTPPFLKRWPAGQPSATALLIAISAGAFAAQWIIQIVLTEPETKNILWQWLALDGPSFRAAEYWKLLSFPLLHADLFHVLANLLLLYFAGREVESILGPRHFIAIYLLGNVVGGLAHLVALPWTPVVGISSGVAAVTAAFTTILPELEVTVLLFFVLPLRLRAKYLALALLAIGGLLWVTLNATSIGPAGIIAATLFGWAYTKQLGFGNPLAIQRYLFEKRERAARFERMSAEQFVRDEIDPILEKISRDGLRSLSRAERKILEQGREKIAAKPAPPKR